MEKPREDELVKLKQERIARLNKDLQTELAKNAKETTNPWVSEFGIDADTNDFGGGGGEFMVLPSQQITERIQFLEDSLRRQPIEENNVLVGDKIIKKDDFNRNITIFVFHTNPGGREVIRFYGQIPSLDGIKLPILFRYGGLNDGEYVNAPKTQKEFHALKTSRSGHRNCNVELSRCGIRKLGSVEFPPFAYTINLSDNDITSLQGVTFGHCVEINLARNFISSLNGCRFSEGTTLLDLRDNNITKLADLNFEALPRSLERVILDGNPIMDNPEGITGYETTIYNEIMRYIREPPPKPSAPQLTDIPGGSKQKSKTKRKVIRKLKKTNKQRNTKNRRKIN
jgi:hypothetical protein